MFFALGLGIAWRGPGTFWTFFLFGSVYLKEMFATLAQSPDNGWLVEISIVGFEFCQILLVRCCCLVTNGQGHCLGYNILKPLKGLLCDVLFYTSKNQLEM